MSNEEREIKIIELTEERIKLRRKQIRIEFADYLKSEDKNELDNIKKRIEEVEIEIRKLINEGNKDKR